MHSDQSGADPPIFSLCQSLDFLVCYLTKDPHLRLESTGRCCIASVRPRSQWFIYLHLGMLNNNRIIDYRNLFSFSFLLYRFSKCTREYCINCSRKLGVASVLIACWLLSHMLDGRFKPGSPPTVPHSLQSSIVCRGLVVNWPAWTQCTRLFTSVDGRNKRLQDNKPTAFHMPPVIIIKEHVKQWSRTRHFVHARQLQVGLLKYEEVLLNLQLRPIQRHPYVGFERNATNDA